MQRHFRFESPTECHGRQLASQPRFGSSSLSCLKANSPTMLLWRRCCRKESFAVPSITCRLIDGTIFPPHGLCLPNHLSETSSNNCPGCSDQLRNPTHLGCRITCFCDSTRCAVISHCHGSRLI